MSTVTIRWHPTKSQWGSQNESGDWLVFHNTASLMTKAEYVAMVKKIGKELGFKVKICRKSTKSKP